jgi:type IV pilus assembly protein PilC
MAVFTYKARDQKGELVGGTINAGSAADASRSLRAEGKFVLSIVAGVAQSDAEAIELLKTREAARRVNREEVIDFCQQLSVMLETGVALSNALDAFNLHARTGEIRRITTIVAEEVKSGSTLSSALARWPSAFPPLVISLIEASEASGTMALMLGRVAKYLSKELKTARQIKGALTYPSIMVLLSLAVTAFLMTAVLPRFAAIYTSRSAMLPAPTRVMLAISNFWTEHWPSIALGAVITCLIGWVFFRRPQGQRMIDWLRLHLPIVGGIYRKVYLTRATRTLATLLSAGVELLKSIRIARGITDNIYFQELWDSSCETIEQGQQLSQSLCDTSLIPGHYVQMIAAGEQGGRLGQVMERIGEVIEEELDVTIARATRYIEPLMIGIMGIVIGFVAIALLLPIFTISNVLH